MNKQVHKKITRNKSNIINITPSSNQKNDRFTKFERPDNWSMERTTKAKCSQLKLNKVSSDIKQTNTPSIKTYTRNKSLPINVDTNKLQQSKRQCNDTVSIHSKFKRMKITPIRHETIQGSTNQTNEDYTNQT